MNTQSFERKSKLTSEEKFLACFYRSIEQEKVMQQIMTVQKVFDNYYANDKIFSLGPKESIESNNSKNSCFHDDKRFWPFFARIIEFDKHQGVPDVIRFQMYPDKNFKKDKITSLGPMMSIETNIF